MKKTEKILIDITFDLLYKKGYCATSLTDILEIANMTKGAMYYHFKSKQALVLATVKDYLEHTLNEQWVTPLKESDEPIKTLIEQIEAYHSMFADRKHFLDIKHGSPLSNFVLDMSDKDEELFTYLKSAYEIWQLSVEDALTKAKSQKQTKTDFDSKNQALFIISSIEGSIGSAKAYNDLSNLKNSFDILSNYIKNL
ncbi:MAG: TetR/AcrR family transcriptional regulator [Sulfurimonas sp.]|nr:TetR/AcrR family transcriptional regulator [Sulfurimonas sp.]